MTIGHDVERCPCGLPLHYTDREAEAAVRKLIADLGPDIIITTGGESWWVPRHYIALHGVSGAGLGAVARRLGFRRATAR